MILVEIRPSGAEKSTIAVHPKVTVLRGLDDAGRRAWVEGLAKALGGAAGPMEIDVELDGKRQALTPALAAQLGLDATTPVTVLPGDLPGAFPAASTSPSDEAARDLRKAEARVAELGKRLSQAQRAARDAATELGKAKSGLDDTAATRIPGLEAILDAARTTTEDARRKLVDAETRIGRMREEQTAERAEFKASIERLQAERSKLEADRTELVGRMIEVGDPGDPKPVEDALNGLRRLRSVKPKPSSRANELADEWTKACARLAALPQPPQPPEWLVSPALEALQEAREAVAAAQSAGQELEIDPARVAALDRAHREVLEAEQRTMKKSSRSNRKKLEAAHEAEQAALSALGVTSYGEYLQHVAPSVNGGGNREERLAAAKAALADAEAVWEELHGGQASPEWTEAKQHQAAIRQEALGLLGEDVEDPHLAAALRRHLETVVDTGWAEQALVDALRRAGVTDVEEGPDLESIAERWLEESPARREARATLETELSDVDARLAAVEEQLGERQANDFFGEDDPPAAEPVDGPTSVASLRSRLEDAEATEREAEASLQRLRAEASAAETKKTVLSGLEQTAEARRVEVETVSAELGEAESALEAAKAAAAASEKEQSTEGSGFDLSAVVGMEAEAYLLARVAALRGAAGGPLPMVVDGAALSGLSERAGRRVFRLLGRLADSMQLVVLGDGEEIATWAEGLGDRAAVRTVAR